LSGFTLNFVFSENPFFSNTVLTKTYKLLCEQGINSTVLESAEGCEIAWKEGKNLTVVLKKKKQKAKGRGGQTRTITKEEPCESFFNFFKPPQQATDDAEEEQEDIEELIEADFELGRTIKESIIPKAVDWYTGKAANEEGFEMEEDEEDEEGDSEDVSDDEPRPKKGGKAAKGGAPPQECKQQ
jgi:nucleosome assembly protein 1-like 1